MKGTIKKRTASMLSMVMALSLILAAGCGSSGGGGDSSGTSAVETTPEPSRNVKGIKLGDADKFAILAYSSITSIPNSSITGKIGLMPGTREAIAIDPSKEVAGGPDDMYGSDDETVPINLLTNAKLDMISAYNETAIRKADANKVGTYQGKLGGKVLPPGIYKWSSAVNITADYTLDGSASDAWIFQVNGELNVGANVKMNLVGGANAHNIIWQVTGPVTLGANSFTAGTIIALPSITMKSQSVLKGRAFAKNGKVVLEQATVSRP